jgi:hypothetical protein
LDRTPLGPSAKRSAGTPRRGSAAVPKEEPPDISRIFSPCVMRASSASMRASSACTVPTSAMAAAMPPERSEERIM